MKILLKFPTKSRPKQFIETLKLYKETCDNPHNVQVLVSYDSDDTTMTQAVILEAKKIFDKTVCMIGQPQGKINACNRDMEMVSGWDIVILVSDDMIPQRKGWDKIISKQMPDDFDRVLWFNDGYIGRRLNTMCILGRKYYERFGYIYHPSYQSLFCDNEQTEVFQRLGKFRRCDICIIQHQWTAQPFDELHARNESPKMYDVDFEVFKVRKLKNFNLELINDY